MRNYDSEIISRHHPLSLPRAALITAVTSIDLYPPADELTCQDVEIAAAGGASKEKLLVVHFVDKSPGGCRTVGTPFAPKNTARN